MFEMYDTKTFFENDQVRVHSTPLCDPDSKPLAVALPDFEGTLHPLVAVLENKKPYSLVIIPLNGDGEMAFKPFVIDPEDEWCIYGDTEQDRKLFNAVKAGAIDCIEPERWAEVDEKFGTTFADEYDEDYDRL